VIYRMHRAGLSNRRQAKQYQVSARTQFA